MNGETLKTPRPAGGAAFSTLWVAKLIPLFDGFDLGNVGRWTNALDGLACQGRVDDRAALMMLLSERVLPALAREELPLAVRAWEAAGASGGEVAPDSGAAAPAAETTTVRRRRATRAESVGDATRPGPAVVRAAVEARRMEAPCEAFLAALLYDRVTRLVGRAAGMLLLSEKTCREVIKSSLERAPKLVEAALLLQPEQLNA